MPRRSNPTAPRTFNTRNDLWDLFANVATELDCSIDYLLNDAMKQYARQRGLVAKPHTTEPKQVSAPPRPAASTRPAPVAVVPRPNLPPPLPPPSRTGGRGEGSSAPPPPSHRGRSNRPSGFVATQGRKLPPPLPPGQVASAPPPPPSRIKRAAG